MKILVTGGAGFIGSHVTDGFLHRGHKVVVLDNLSTGRRENINPKSKFYLMDIRSLEVEKIFAIEQFDAICHHAAQMDVRKSVNDPLFDADINVKGSLNLLQNCIKFNVKKFLFASTGGAVYGEQKKFPCNEKHPLQPVSPYGITKLTLEKYLFYYALQFGLNYTILRYANVYGPRQNPEGEAGVVAIFSNMLLQNKQPIINGDGKQTRDYIYVDDVARANIKGIKHKKNNIFNIGTGIETDVNKLFTNINELTGNKAKEKHGPAMPGEQQRSVIDYTNARILLNWKPEISLNLGLELTVNHFRKQQ